ncbi:hypothetical protein SAMN05421853_11767 [Roseivivax halotolerans]|uniref:Helix-turn-helix domain-containing protein n=2 Tax=Roseivivax halotolerans TaxID=93684 RepID=A0A1I6ACY1_9RHOB|nr:hypothetical protein SAMN05421853_11767 [Roseivivax halotolerans]
MAKEDTAARLLDMKPTEFRGLVEGGHLPAGREIAGIRRWDVEELRKIFRGEMADGGFEW